MTPAPGSRFAAQWRIGWVAVPVILSFVSEGIVTAVDTAMIRGFGDSGLAAVGVATVILLLAVSITSGFATGAQALIGRERGAKRSGTPVMVAALVVLPSIALALIALISTLAGPVVGSLSQTPAVETLARGYLGARVLGLIGVGVRGVSRAYWIATERPFRYLSLLVTEQVANIVLDVVLIFGWGPIPAFGVVGAGMASAMAAWLGACVHLRALVRAAPERDVLRWSRVTRPMIVGVLQRGAPVAIQQVLFAGYATAFFAVTVSLGTRQAAVSKVVYDFIMPAWMICVAAGMTVTSFVSSALGASQPHEARRWPWRAYPTIALLCSPLFVAGLLAPASVVGLFITDPQTVTLAVPALFIIVLALPLEGLTQVCTFGLLGAGKGKMVVWLSVVPQWFVALPLVYGVAHVWGGDVFGAWATHAGYRVVSAVVFIWAWRVVDLGALASEHAPDSAEL